LDVSESCNQGTHLTFLVGLQEGDQFDAIFVQQTPHMFLPYLSDVLQHEDVSMSQQNSRKNMGRKNMSQALGKSPRNQISTTAAPVCNPRKVPAQP